MKMMIGNQIHSQVYLHLNKNDYICVWVFLGL